MDKARDYQTRKQTKSNQTNLETQEYNKVALESKPPALVALETADIGGALHGIIQYTLANTKLTDKIWHFGPKSYN